ncbi:carboxymuconolactone decarboxylase family protein [Nonomuraea sp. B10E15]|uniref:carboxymuconolactone decarboxylase family protein n=1 Tax=unclassified Nonomuraea TaxID=2593643 RepID=UPI00325CD56F
MDARFDYAGNPVGAKAAKAFVSASKVVSDSALPATTRELVMLRVSQINGCAVCIDQHTKEAAHAGETSVRINLVSAWREATVFTDAERAALELAEQGTRTADAGGVTDEAWADAAKHHDDDQLAALTALIAVMNAWNRMNIITRQPATGDFEPGQWG